MQQSVVTQLPSTPSKVGTTRKPLMTWEEVEQFILDGKAPSTEDFEEARLQNIWEDEFWITGVPICTNIPSSYTERDDSARFDDDHPLNGTTLGNPYKGFDIDAFFEPQSFEIPNPPSQETSKKNRRKARRGTKMRRSKSVSPVDLNAETPWLSPPVDKKARKKWGLARTLFNKIRVPTLSTTTWGSHSEISWTPSDLGRCHTTHAEDFISTSSCLSNITQGIFQSSLEQPFRSPLPSFISANPELVLPSDYDRSLFSVHRQGRQEFLVPRYGDDYVVFRFMLAHWRLSPLNETFAPPAVMLKTQDNKVSLPFRRRKSDRAELRRLVLKKTRRRRVENITVCLSEDEVEASEEQLQLLEEELGRIPMAVSAGFVEWDDDEACVRDGVDREDDSQRAS